MNIATPLINQTTKAQLEQLAYNPQQSTLLIGDKGSNYHDIVQWYAALLANTQKIKPEHIHHIQKADKENTIGIDAVQQVLSKIKYKSSATQGTLVCIHDAHIMTPEAQNRLLKTLEEPSQFTYFILSTSHIDMLLPTIRSRVGTLTVQNPSQEQILAEYKHLYEHADIQRAYMLSQGAIKTLESVLENKEDTTISMAKTIVSSKYFERLTLVDTLAKDREEAKSVISVLIRIYETILRQSIQKAEDIKIKHYIQALEICNESLDGLQKNANAKIVLTRLFLNI